MLYLKIRRNSTCWALLVLLLLPQSLTSQEINPNRWKRQQVGNNLIPESQMLPVLWEPNQPDLQPALGSHQSLPNRFEEQSENQVVTDPYCCENAPWVWQLLPAGLLYHSYLAGPKESRMATAWLYKKDHGWIWDATLGGRVGIIRYGTESSNDPPGPEGFQMDIEGASLTRLNVEEKEDLDAVDFRFGIPFSYRKGPYALKFGYYHISSHLGDEYILKNPGVQRLNYVRDSLLLGVAVDFTPEILLYAEAAWAFNADVAKPWEFQFGAEYSPSTPIDESLGVPFFAINGHLREEVGFGGGVSVMTGWQFHSTIRRRLRLGFQYYNGKSLQYVFFDEHEELMGFGIWFDY